MSRNLCSVKDCKNTKHEKPFLSFHFFPTKEPERLRKWAEFCENETINKLLANHDPKLEHKSICSEHFEDNKYNNPMKKIRLMCNAVPTIKTNEKKRTDIGQKVDLKPSVQVIPAQVLLRTNLSRRWQPSRSVPSNACSVSDKHKPSQVNAQYQDNAEQSAAIIPKPNPIIRHFSAQHMRYEDEVRNLREKLAKTRKQAMNLRYRLKRTNPIGNTRKSKLNYILKNIKSMSEEVLNPIVSEMIEYHLMSAFLNKPRVHKWSNRMKKFCSDVYHKSPSAYSIMQKTLTLPTKKTVLKFAEDRIQLTKNETLKANYSEQTNRQSDVVVTEIITTDKFSEQQLITLDPIEEMLSHNELGYINIEYTTCDQTSDQLDDTNCIELTPIEINVTNAVTIDRNNIESNSNQIGLTDKSSPIKTYSRIK